MRNPSLLGAVARFCVGVVALAVAASVPAIDVQEFAEAEQRARYDALLSELRCLVCQNQTLADSSAPLAQDMRGVVAAMVRAGGSDGEIIAVMTDRYGDFVRFRPVLDHRTALLWFAPFVLVLVAAALVPMLAKQQRKVTLSKEQRIAARRLLDEGE